MKKDMRPFVAKQRFKIETEPEFDLDIRMSSE